MPSTEPGLALRFELIVDDAPIGAWTGLQDFKSQYEIYEHPEGGENGFVHRFPGRLKHSNIKLSRSINSESGKLAAWFDKYQQEVKRSTASIIVFDANSKKVAQWDFEGVVPVSLTGPNLDVKGKGTAVETLELAHRGYKYV